MTGHYVPMTPEWEAQIVADLQSGMRIIDVAMKHEIGKRRVMNIRNKHGIERKGHGPGRYACQKMTPELEARIVADLRSGVILSDIQKRHHVGYERVADIQSKYDLWRGRGEYERDEDVDWEKYAPIWDRVRIVVLKAMEKKTKKQRSWIDLWLLEHESR